MENNQIQELEQIKAQMNLLRTKLQKHDIVTEDMLNQIVSKNIGNINYKIIWEIVISLVVMLFIPSLFTSMYNLSNALFIYLILSFLLPALFGCCLLIIAPKPKTLGYDILYAEKRVESFVYWYRINLICQMILLITAFVWMFIEIEGDISGFRFFILAIIGLFLGVVIAINEHKAMVKKVNEIRNSIKLLE